MNRLLLLFFCISLLGIASLSAQDSRISYGIRAGLGFSKIVGEAEEDTSGNSLEESKFYTGFNASITLYIELIEDKFGLAPELQFSQKGGKYRYNGQGFYTESLGSSTVIAGNRRDAITNINSYVSVPVLVYYRPIERIRIAAGFDVGILVSSVGNGQNKFNWTDLSGDEQEITTALDYAYLSDGIGEAKTEETTILTVDGGGTVINAPNTIGAYYYYPTDEGNYFNRFDMGLNAEVSVFITRGIALSLRANYGLLDVTNNAYDFSRQTGVANSRSDKDRNLSLQLSLGFNF